MHVQCAFETVPSSLTVNQTLLETLKSMLWECWIFQQTNTGLASLLCISHHILGQWWQIDMPPAFFAEPNPFYLSNQIHLTSWQHGCNWQEKLAVMKKFIAKRRRRRKHSSKRNDVAFTKRAANCYGNIGSNAPFVGAKPSDPPLLILKNAAKE